MGGENQRQIAGGRKDNERKREREKERERAIFGGSDDGGGGDGILLTVPFRFTFEPSASDLPIHRRPRPTITGGNCRNNGESVEVEGGRQKRPFEKKRCDFCAGDATRVERGGGSVVGDARSAERVIDCAAAASAVVIFGHFDKGLFAQIANCGDIFRPPPRARFHYFSFNFTMRRALRPD